MRVRVIVFQQRVVSLPCLASRFVFTEEWLVEHCDSISIPRDEVDLDNNGRLNVNEMEPLCKIGAVVA